MGGAAAVQTAVPYFALDGVEPVASRSRAVICAAASSRARDSNAKKMVCERRTPSNVCTSVTPAPPAAQTLEGVLRSHTIFFALETLARELAAAQITARELVSPSSVPTGAQ